METTKMKIAPNIDDNTIRFFSNLTPVAIRTNTIPGKAGAKKRSKIGSKAINDLKIV